MILQSPNPRKFALRDLQDLEEDFNTSAFTNRWLVFQNIKFAAINGDFSLVKIGFNRNEALLAAMADTYADRKAFVEWAVDFIRSNTKINRKITQKDLFDGWSVRGGQTYAKTFFTTTLGTPLSMRELRMQAFPDAHRRRPVPAAAGWGDDDSEPGGGGADSDLNQDESNLLHDDASIGAAPVSGEAREAAAEKEKAEAKDREEDRQVAAEKESNAVASRSQGTYQSMPASPCPVLARPPLTAADGRLLHGFQYVMPARGSTLREIVSQILVTMQFPFLHSVLPSECLGVSDALLLKDGELIALYEWAYGFQTGYLGPSGRCQPAFQFRWAFLDRPSKEASAASLVLVAEAIRDMSLLDWSDERGSCDAIFLKALRRLLDGAGRGPLSPKKEGWIDVRANPALTDALAEFAVHGGVTVGQSVEAVAWAREGKRR
jgi:hypothetical protein